MEHSKHIWRGAILLTVVLTALVVGRHFLIPQSFGEMGHFRGDALYELMALPPVHGAPGACAECHDGIAAAKAQGGHRTVECEVCHGPLAGHVQDGEKIADMPVDRSWQRCAQCHRYLAARPAAMPQIDLREHLDLGPQDPVPAEACLDCHDRDAIHSP